MTWWSVVRFLHVSGAALWVGGQLTISLVLLPLARQKLPAEQYTGMAREVGRRFGIFTGAVFLPVQITTGVAMARHKGVTWASLAEPGYGRILAAKLLLFGAVIAIAGVHGWASSRHPSFARAMALASLAGSVGIVLIATALPST
ncbi:Predicted integral membrane protein [Mycobacterium tuberculosis]|nr:Predicted integral membrane protein [Mycobacterium tuberculosis]